jgi:uncharacterized protein HemX
MSDVNVAVTVIVALVSGTGGWGVLQFILTRTGRKAEIARQQAETERATQESEKFKQETAAHESDLLQRAQVIAQRTALDSAAKRYRELREDYEEQRRSLRALRSATETLIDVVDAIAARMRPTKESETVMVKVSAQEYLATRSAIAEARRHLR